MEKYCCFFDPKNDQAEKELEDNCPDCGRTYGFPLTYPPAKIRDLDIERPLDRGFYGVTYIARRGAFKRYVVKITPKTFYDFFKKTTFKAEWELHITCLTKVCVGDIGDVIKLYDRILANYDGAKPIQPAKQSDCFLSLSSQRLFELNRRQTKFKDAAKTFAEASHELLQRSYRLMKVGKSKRLREYASVYVRVTTEDQSERTKQIDMLRDLIDAGIFVYTASGTPRTKTKDSDPLLQFKLTYRKIYGLTSYIGMADRDRFELSGADLEEWLQHPEKGKEVLLRNQTQEYAEDCKQAADDKQPEVAPGKVDEQTAPASHPAQGDLFVRRIETSAPVAVPSVHPFCVQEIGPKDLRFLGIKRVVVGLGFEDRALRTSELLSASLDCSEVSAVGYRIPGHAEAIKAHWTRIGASVRELPDDSASARMAVGGDGLALVDISGLSKPFIFHAIRSGLAATGNVIIAYGMAQRYYPTPEDVEVVFRAQQAGSKYQLLERLGEVLTGELAPYSCEGLLDSTPDETRTRALLAFSSPKHQRIFRLLDDREFDEIEIITPADEGSRSRLSRLAADVITQTRQHAETSQVDVMNFQALLNHCDDRYLNLYHYNGANVEVGLTGSKLQAAAVAVLSAHRRFSQAWYVKPSAFDANKFSEGFAGLRIFLISRS